MATITVMLKTHRIKDDGTFPVCIRVTEGNKSRYKYIGHSVKKEQFKSGLADWIRKHPDALFINSLIEDERSRMQEKITRLRLDKKPFDFKYVLSDIPAEGHTLGEILDIIANRHFKAEDLTLGYRHVSLKNQVKESLGKDILLNAITLEEVREIAAHFKKVGNNKNTVQRKIRFLRAAFNEAIGIWKGEIGGNPFNLIRCGGEPVNRKKLNKDNIEVIEKLSLVGYIDNVRDAFLFAYYAQGMRFSSVVTLTRPQITEAGIKYQMTKGDHYRVIGIHPKLKRIIEKYWDSNTPYLFPFLSEIPKTKTQMHYALGEANVMFNTAMKRLGILAGIDEEISFHFAKHAYAQLLKKSGVDPWVAKDSLGHSNFATSEMYMDSLDDDHINNAVTGLF